MTQSCFTMTRHLILILSFALLGLFACSDNPTAPEEEDQVDQTVETVSANGAQVYSTVASVKQIGDLMRGPEAIVDLDVPDFENPGNAVAFAGSVKKTAFADAQSRSKGLSTLSSVLGDSIIWDITYRNEVLGITFRNSLRYDHAEDVARLFVVGFEYRENHPLMYDSTEIKAHLNSTLDDTTDDVLISVENLKKYKPGRLIQQQWGSFVPDPYPAGSEPTGGTLTNDVTYSSSSFISNSHAELAYHEDSGGSYSREITFSDNKKHTESVTFKEDGTGTFEEIRRDGTHVEGTFDGAEQDGQGSFTKSVTFPAGHDPVSISESGEFTINTNDSTLNGSFEKEIRFRDNSVRSESVEVNQVRVGDVLTTSLNVESTDGGSGFITITEAPDVDQIAGEWTNPDLTFLVFAAEYYPDGSAHLKFDLYASEEAFENGLDPIASGEFDFFPDGSGQGTVVSEGLTHEVTINADGSIIIKTGTGAVARANIWN